MGIPAWDDSKSWLFNTILELSTVLWSVSLHKSIIFLQVLHHIFNARSHRGLGNSWMCLSLRLLDCMHIMLSGQPEVGGEEVLIGSSTKARKFLTPEPSRISGIPVAAECVLRKSSVAIRSEKGHRGRVWFSKISTISIRVALARILRMFKLLKDGLCSSMSISCWPLAKLEVSSVAAPTLLSGSLATAR